MTRTIPLALTAILLGACGDPSVMWKAHQYDMPGKMGTVEEMVVQGKRAQVHYMPALDVAKSICAKVANTETAGCTLWISDPDKLTPRSREIMNGFDCQVYVPPNRYLLDHELLHCTKGDYHW